MVRQGLANRPRREVAAPDLRAGLADRVEKDEIELVVGRAGDLAAEPDVVTAAASTSPTDASIRSHASVRL